MFFGENLGKIIVAIADRGKGRFVKIEKMPEYKQKNRENVQVP